MKRRILRPQSNQCCFSSGPEGGGQEAVDVLSHHKKSLETVRRQWRKSARGRDAECRTRKEKNERARRPHSLRSQTLPWKRGGRFQKYPTLLKYCVLCPHGEREGRNSYLAWPDSAMTPTLKSSQIATLAAWLSLRSGHRTTVRAWRGLPRFRHKLKTLQLRPT